MQIIPNHRLLLNLLLHFFEPRNVTAHGDKEKKFLSLLCGGAVNHRKQALSESLRDRLNYKGK